MFSFLKSISKKLVILGIISIVFVIFVAFYLDSYAHGFDWDKDPIIAFSILGFIILQPISFLYLAAIIRRLERNLVDYDVEVSRRIKEIKEKSANLSKTTL